MTEDTGIIPLRQSEDFDDVLTTIARDGAQRMLAAALVAGADAFVAGFSEDRLADGVYLQARMEEQAECMLVIIGVTPEGKKELELGADHN